MTAQGAYRTPADKQSTINDERPKVVWSGQTPTGEDMRIVRTPAHCVDPCHRLTVEVSDTTDAMGMPVWHPFDPLSYAVILSGFGSGLTEGKVTEAKQKIMDVIMTLARAIDERSFV